MGWIVLGIVLGFIGYGVAKGLAEQARDSKHNTALREYLDDRDAAFKGGVLKGRRWLAQFLAEAEAALDPRESYLRHKKHPARKSAEVVAEIRKEKRALATKVKFLEYQLRSYEEYFPALADYREAILNETIPLASSASGEEALEEADPCLQFLSSEEWQRLSPADRHQRALERYVARPKSNWEIGRHFERYLGYRREIDRWSVTFFGAVKGFEDLGRDLICARGKQVEIIQAKCWSSTKTIHEKHVFQLFGTTLLYRLQNPEQSVTAVLAVTTSLSGVATLAAKELGIVVERHQLPAHYPLIKCNIGRASGDRIYHLPFDQQYDRVKIDGPDESYVATVAEAEARGFRRAWRYRGNGKAH